MSGKISASGIILDVDNTLIATFSFIRDHLKRTCNKIGIDKLSTSDLKIYLKTNPHFEEIFDHFFGKKGSKVLEKYREDAPDYHYKATKNAIPFIKKTDELNIPTVIVTNRIRMIEERLIQAGFNPNSFEDIVSLDVPKPDTHAYDSAIKSLNKLGAKKKSILFIGDHPDDYRAVPDALKVNFIAVLTGLNIRKEFESLGVNKLNILSDLGEMSKIIKPYNG